MSEQPPSAHRPLPDSRRGAAIALIFVALLVIGGLVLVHILHKSSDLQDCVMSGRTNCAPVDPSSTGNN